MDHAIVKNLAVAVCVLALLVALPGAALAQDDSESSVMEGPPVEGDPSWYVDAPEASEEAEVEGAEAEFVLAQPPYTMNYQGYLTDSAGVPVDGAYDFVAGLYDAESGGVQEWGPENHDDVPVANGLFNLVLGSTTPLVPNVFDEALFLQLTVGSTELPRQPLRTTAYAFGLVPGAEVQGEPTGSDYGLYVYNNSSNNDARGLYARGKEYGIYAIGDKYGIYATEAGTGDVGIYTPNFAQAGGYRSNSDSYVFVPGHVAIASDKPASSQVTIDPETGGYVQVKSTAVSNNRWIYLPIQVPSVLYGQKVTIEHLQLYYELSHPNDTFITRVRLDQRDVSNGDLVVMLNSETDLKGTGMSSASFTPSQVDDVNVLSSTTGPVTLSIIMEFQNIAHTIKIYGVRLRLGHR